MYSFVSKQSVRVGWCWIALASGRRAGRIHNKDITNEAALHVLLKKCKLDRIALLPTFVCLKITDD